MFINWVMDILNFLAIGTAVKKSTSIKTESDQLLPQAIVVDNGTFYDSRNENSFSVDVNRGRNPLIKDLRQH